LNTIKKLFTCANQTELNQKLFFAELNSTKGRRNMAKRLSLLNRF